MSPGQCWHFTRNITTAFTAVRRYCDKMTKYFHDCDREGIQFFPIVMEALVGWHSDAAADVSKLARQLASLTGGGGGNYKVPFPEAESFVNFFNMKHLLHNKHSLKMIIILIGNKTQRKLITRCLCNEFHPKFTPG